MLVFVCCCCVVVFCVYVFKFVYYFFFFAVEQLLDSLSLSLCVLFYMHSCIFEIKIRIVSFVSKTFRTIRLRVIDTLYPSRKCSNTKKRKSIFYSYFFFFFDNLMLVYVHVI